MGVIYLGHVIYVGHYLLNLFCMGKYGPVTSKHYVTYENVTSTIGTTSPIHKHITGKIMSYQKVSLLPINGRRVFSKIHLIFRLLPFTGFATKSCV